MNSLVVCSLRTDCVWVHIARGATTVYWERRKRHFVLNPAAVLQDVDSIINRTYTTCSAQYAAELKNILLEYSQTPMSKCLPITRGLVVKNSTMTQHSILPHNIVSVHQTVIDMNTLWDYNNTRSISCVLVRCGHLIIFRGISYNRKYDFAWCFEIRVQHKQLRNHHDCDITNSWAH